MTTSLPLIIAGPMLRHCDSAHFTLWFVSREPLGALTLTLAEQEIKLTEQQIHCIPLGKHAYQYLISLEQDGLLSHDIVIHYQVVDAQKGNLFSAIEGLTYHDNPAPSLVCKTQINQLLHGSCRNPHHHSGDALVAADTQLSQHLSPTERPALMMLSGDQVYVDDVAGPMLHAIGQVITLLGLPTESLTQAPIDNSKRLDYRPQSLYQRHKKLLPHTQYPVKTALLRWYRNHPIFTSSVAENHLISLSEVIALYLLTWSPELWKLVDIPAKVNELSPQLKARWEKEWQHLLAFKAGLVKVRRLFAHLPTYMIFDDHDITDDWNLTAKWEQAAYGHPFSKRIIGNALIGYTLFQGLGNAPHQFATEIAPLIDQFFATQASQDQDDLIEALLKFEHWHYTLSTSPKLVVLDTRTRRWRSESNLAKPSGLMDWEALMDMQQELIDQSKVIIVSPAPMFGVKLIEAIQRTATLLGGSLLVDAENWMAHPGAANTLLSIFLHRKTPQQFVILSGDVHYSFSYDVSIRFRSSSPHIYQICSSGLKNQFPEKLLPRFDKLNGWLYGHFSPLNLFTKRKRMSIRGRRPNGARSQRLVNLSGVGVVDFSDSGEPIQIAILHSDMTQTIFEPPRQEA